jgi:hypothetical protein
VFLIFQMKKFASLLLVFDILITLSVTTISLEKEEVFFLKSSLRLIMNKTV